MNPNDMKERAVWKTEQSHTGGHLCRHNHRTRSGAERCLPRLTTGQCHRGAFSLARVVAMNDAAIREDTPKEDQA